MKTNIVLTVEKATPSIFFRITGVPEGLMSGDLFTLNLFDDEVTTAVVSYRYWSASRDALVFYCLVDPCLFEALSKKSTRNKHARQEYNLPEQEWK